MCVCTTWCLITAGCDAPTDDAEAPTDLSPPDEAVELRDYDGDFWCQIPDNLAPPSLMMAFAGAPQVESLDSSSKSGEFHVTLHNSSDTPIEVSLTLIINIGTTEAIELPSSPLPARSSVDLPIDLSKTKIKGATTDAPAQLLLKAATKAGGQTFSDPVYTHFDEKTQVYRLYGGQILKRKFANGDLKGVLKLAGATPGAQFVGSGVSAE